MSFSIKKLIIIPVFIISILSSIALLELYSLSCGNIYPWVMKQFIKLCFGLVIFCIVISIDINIWKRYAYLFYMMCIVLLIMVSIAGKTVMGAQRWLSLYFFSVQPSELMRISLITALAKYFSELSIEEIRKTKYIIFPTLVALLPIALVLQQPDLGTAMLLLLVYFSMLFVAGIQFWKLGLFLVIGMMATPMIWSHLHEYQRKRILMFLMPETDPNGAGYHIIQSKISLGSGGLFGKGFMKGTQCQLNFLPEKHNDFIFAAIGEEFGFIGCVFLLVLYLVLLLYNYNIAIQAQNKFDRYLVFGLNSMLFFYIFINISMVCGLLPVVGIPLPFLSYGGAALTVLMLSEALILSAYKVQSSS